MLGVGDREHSGTGTVTHTTTIGQEHKAAPLCSGVGGDSRDISDSR